jgi:hypothetical protein
MEKDKVSTLSMARATKQQSPLKDTIDKIEQ